MTSITQNKHLQLLAQQNYGPRGCRDLAMLGALLGNEIQKIGPFMVECDGQLINGPKSVYELVNNGDLFASKVMKNSLLLTTPLKPQPSISASSSTSSTLSSFATADTATITTTTMSTITALGASISATSAPSHHASSTTAHEETKTLAKPDLDCDNHLHHNHNHNHDPNTIAGPLGQWDNQSIVNNTSDPNNRPQTATTTLQRNDNAATTTVDIAALPPVAKALLSLSGATVPSNKHNNPKIYPTMLATLFPAVVFKAIRKRNYYRDMVAAASASATAPRPPSWAKLLATEIYTVQDLPLPTELCFLGASGLPLPPTLRAMHIAWTISFLENNIACRRVSRRQQQEQLEEQRLHQRRYQHQTRHHHHAHHHRRGVSSISSFGSLILEEKENEEKTENEGEMEEYNTNHSNDSLGSNGISDKSTGSNFTQLQPQRKRQGLAFRPDIYAYRMREGRRPIPAFVYPPTEPVVTDATLPPQIPLATSITKNNQHLIPLLLSLESKLPRSMSQWAITARTCYTQELLMQDGYVQELVNKYRVKTSLANGTTSNSLAATGSGTNSGSSVGTRSRRTSQYATANTPTTIPEEDATTTNTTTDEAPVPTTSTSPTSPTSSVQGIFGLGLDFNLNSFQHNQQQHQQQLHHHHHYYQNHHQMQSLHGWLSALVSPS